MDGQSGADVMLGGLGDDVYYIDDVGDVLIEEEDSGYDKVISNISYSLGEHLEELWLRTGTSALTADGNDLDNKIVGNQNDNIIYGYDGRDELLGGPGDDFIFGGAGNDLIFGGAGHDALYGGTGNDLMGAGSGANVFHFAVGSGSDIIKHFKCCPRYPRLLGHCRRGSDHPAKRRRCGDQPRRERSADDRPLDGGMA